MWITVPTSLIGEVTEIPFFQFAQTSSLDTKDGTELTQVVLLNKNNSKARLLLKEMEIPYDSCIGDSADTFHVRFTKEGDSWTHVCRKEETKIPLEYLIPLADKPVELAAFIKNHEKAIAIPSWENQEIYRKRRLARKLINPEE